jgi:ABC-type Fe3+/spermidine/putrescine transport system ATPase subunit
MKYGRDEVSVENLESASTGSGIFKNCSLDPDGGATVVILMLSACGKTTLLKPIAGFPRP